MSWARVEEASLEAWACFAFVSVALEGRTYGSTLVSIYFPVVYTSVHLTDKSSYILSPLSASPTATPVSYTHLTLPTKRIV